MTERKEEICRDKTNNNNLLFNREEKNMKYAITYTNPGTYGWEETNTMLVECDRNPLDIGLEQLSRVLADFAGCDEQEARDILGNDSWYIRNCSDTDATIVTME